MTPATRHMWWRSCSGVMTRGRLYHGRVGSGGASTRSARNTTGAREVHSEGKLYTHDINSNASRAGALGSCREPSRRERRDAPKGAATPASPTGAPAAA